MACSTATFYGVYKKISILHRYAKIEGGTQDLVVSHAVINMGLIAKIKPMLPMFFCKINKCKINVRSK